MKKLFLGLLLLLPLLLSAKIETRYLTVEGSGSTRAAAVKNALIEAVKQTKGVKISSKRDYYKGIRQTAISIDGDSTHAVSISERSRKLITEATRGFIRNYSIVDSYQDGGEWVVKIQIAMKRYRTPGFNPNKRRKIAVIPFEYKRSYSIFGRSESGSAISSRFTQSLVSKITQSRKFTVLDRENSKYYNQEKNFILSGNSDKKEFMKLGRRLGVDYLLVGKILDFTVKSVTDSNNIGLPESSDRVCSVTISYRILAMATQQIKWSETISKNFSLSDSTNSAEAMVANISDKISDVVLAHILNNIYPLRVVAVTPRSIVLNQGGNGIHEGDIYKAYRRGKRLVDPYTKEYLGYEEIGSGEVEITKVTPKISYARLIRGIVRKGMILRKDREKDGASSKPERDGEAVTDVKIKENGGVVLPF